MRKIIAVYGPSECSPGDPLYEEAYRLGSLLARAGFGVVTGGYEGVMEAVSKGAADAGGHTIAVTAEVYYARGREPNPFVKKEVRVRSAGDRLMELLDLPDAAIAIGASSGTMVEVLTMWDYLKRRFLGPKPLVVIGSDWASLLNSFSGLPYLKEWKRYLHFVPIAEEAVDLLVREFGPQLPLPELDILSN